VPLTSAPPSGLTIVTSGATWAAAAPADQSAVTSPRTSTAIVRAAGRPVVEVVTGPI
jgi:hypothetical protein